MNDCPQTTKRMTEFVLADLRIQFVFLYAGLRPEGEGDTWTTDITIDEMADRMRRFAHTARRSAKLERQLQALRRFREIGSFERVDWTLVAYAVLAASNPILAAQFERQGAGPGFTG